jgi:preprotein translocase subunit Sss1
MSDDNVRQESESQVQVAPTPLRCLIGAVISGGLGYALYLLMIAIATTFANKPIHSDNPMVVNIGSAVRTLVVGVTALGTGIFGVVAIGLLALAVQLLVQQLTQKQQ